MTQGQKQASAPSITPREPAARNLTSLRQRASALRSIVRAARHILFDPTQARGLPTWLLSVAGLQSLAPPVPWLPLNAIARLERVLERGWRVFEYGAGNSTAFWRRHGAEVVSLEHDESWYRAVVAQMPSADRASCILHVPADAPAPGLAAGVFDPSDPDLYQSDDQAFRQRTFRAYVTAIDRYPSSHFDLILVDGRARPSCIKHALPHLKPGGLLVVDNIDREYYLRKTRALLAGYTLDIVEGYAPTLTSPTSPGFFHLRAR